MLDEFGNANGREEWICVNALSATNAGYRYVAKRSHYRSHFFSIARKRKKYSILFSVNSAVSNNAQADTRAALDERASDNRANLQDK